MEKKYLKISEKTQKIKTKSLALSGVSLFIGLTQSMPTKISLIGLNLEKNELILGWFIFFITIYLLFHFIIMVVVELIEFNSSFFIRKKTNKTTGDTLGLSIDEVMAPEYEAEYREKENSLGTPEQELDDINRKNKIIHQKFNNILGKSRNYITIIFEVFIPIILSIAGLVYLFFYISTLK